ncbi:MAG: 2Fe-2S iron-sulfur cluster-binding protein [Syntrophus sp. (in: bacteria)]|nr:2Fe-2S iron-sulfur cluster-binding protein [Syntrophus sp. (in: bacteria)]
MGDFGWPPGEYGDSIMDAARRAGVVIPSFCYLKGSTATGACRICLVEVAGGRSLMAACSTPVTKGMQVLTNSERVHQARKLNVELLLSSGQHNCMTCEANGNCRLQDLFHACCEELQQVTFAEALAIMLMLLKQSLANVPEMTSELIQSLIERFLKDLPPIYGARWLLDRQYGTVSC